MKVEFGDIIKIGNHRLMCGDSTEEAMVEMFLSDERPRLMVTDPPYGVNFTVRNRKKPQGKVIDGRLEDIRIRNDHRTNWAKSFFLSQAQIAYVWHSSTAIDVALQAVRDGGYEPRQSIVWLKNRMALSRSAYHWRHETAIYGVRCGATANWLGDRKQTTVWQEDIPEPKSRIHPTQKPIEIYTRPIKNHTTEGEIVYDPFVGSGSLFVAAEHTGRIGYGVEFEEKYCERLITRLEDELKVKSEKIVNIFSKNMRRT